MFILLMTILGCSQHSGCTDLFAYSATIELTDQEGVAITDANITYTVDGVEGTYVESWEDGTYVVGGEESGDFVVDIYAQIPDEDGCCTDIGEATLEFTIESDECHVIPQSFNPDLEWSTACIDIEECA